MNQLSDTLKVIDGCSGEVKDKIVSVGKESLSMEFTRPSASLHLSPAQRDRTNLLKSDMNAVSRLWTAYE